MSAGAGVSATCGNPKKFLNASAAEKWLEKDNWLEKWLENGRRPDFFGIYSSNVRNQLFIVDF